MAVLGFGFWAAARSGKSEAKEGSEAARDSHRRSVMPGWVIGVRGCAMLTFAELKSRSEYKRVAAAGAGDEASSAEAVREMFDRIAPRYDLLNHVLSCNVDRTWWWRTARRFRHILGRPEAKVLDICCGTGDMTGRCCGGGRRCGAGDGGGFF